MNQVPAAFYFVVLNGRDGFFNVGYGILRENNIGSASGKKNRDAGGGNCFVADSEICQGISAQVREPGPPKTANTIITINSFFIWITPLVL